MSVWYKRDKEATTLLQTLHIYFRMQELEIELIVALQAAFSKIPTDFKICHI